MKKIIVTMLAGLMVAAFAFANEEAATTAPATASATPGVKVAKSHKKAKRAAKKAKKAKAHEEATHSDHAEEGQAAE